MKSNIIITGITGFVGQNLKLFFEKDYHVLGISRSKTEATVTYEELFKGVQFNNAEAIIHLAGKAHDTRNISEENSYYIVNTDLTIQVFDWFLQSDVNDFFFLSSVKAAADTVEEVLKEESISNPQTPYGKSKLKAEQYILSKDLPKNKRVFIIRPTMIHGEGNKGNLNLLYKLVYKNIPWPLASFENQRSFLTIDNFNFMLKGLLKNKDVMSGIYNFADDTTVSTNELIEVISSTIQKKTRLLRLPVNLVKLIAKLGDLFKLPLNSERLNKLTENYIVSNSKIKSALKIEKLPFTAKEGLVKTIKSFKND